MLQIVSQLALTCKDQSITENWYVENFGFKRARVAKLPDGNEIIFIKMADSSFYLELFKSENESPCPDATNDGHTFPGLRHLAFKVNDVDEKLKSIMSQIHDSCVKYGKEGDFIDYVKGANIAAFYKIADSMIDQGVV